MSSFVNSPFRIVLASLLLLTGAVGLHADEKLPDVSEFLAPLVEKHKVPALAAAVIEGNRLTKLGAAGIRARGAAAKVELDDLWHLGSCTKAMTATLCAQLVEQGKLKWDSKVGEILADQVEQIHADLREVTLEQLLSHRAGLSANPSLPLMLKLATHGGSRDAREMLLSNGWMKSKPDSPPEYVLSSAIRCSSSTSGFSKSRCATWLVPYSDSVLPVVATRLRSMTL